MTIRARWRAWRRSRPFWGGLLLVLSGLELLVLPLTGVLVHGQIKLVIYIGIGGVFGVLIGALLIVSGLALWFNPAHRTFYGIAGLVLGIVSFPASNLGGFFLGMLLAIIGGALGFAWSPLPAAGPAVQASPGPEVSTEPDAVYEPRIVPGPETLAGPDAHAAAESAAEPGTAPEAARADDAGTAAEAEASTVPAAAP
jgi:hypothetical protein